MAHMLDMSNGKGMAFTGEVPWHGLGVQVADNLSPEEMCIAAGVDWTVSRRDMFLAGGVKVPDAAALVRDSDGKVFDVVGNTYKPIQNLQAMSFFKEFVEAGSAKMETVGAIRDGKLIWGLARLGVDFVLPGGDEVRGYLLCANPHEQGKSAIYKFTNVRVVCNNTLTMALGRDKKGEHRVNHRSEFTEVKVDTAKAALGIAREQMREFQGNAEKLVKLKISNTDTLRVLQPIYQPDAELEWLTGNADNWSRPLQAVMHANQKAPGAIPNTGWGVLNAVTYYADHMASRSQDKRLSNAWFGKTASQKEDVYASLLEMAA